jgi:hypothetical protein
VALNEISCCRNTLFTVNKASPFTLIMKNKDNFRTTKREGDSLGERDTQEAITQIPAPETVDKESDTTPPDHEVYVDLEPEELELDEEPLDVNDED